MWKILPIENKYVHAKMFMQKCSVLSFFQNYPQSYSTCTLFTFEQKTQGDENQTKFIVVFKWNVAKFTFISMVHDVK